MNGKWTEKSRRNSVRLDKICYLRCPFVSSCERTEAANLRDWAGVGFVFPERTLDASVESLLEDCLVAMIIPHWLGGQESTLLLIMRWAGYSVQLGVAKVPIPGRYPSFVGSG